MDEIEELKQELEQELQWVYYRQKMLDVMDKKLLEMRQLVERAQAKQDNLTTAELQILNNRLNYLAAQVKALDGESRRIQDDKIL